MELPKVLNAEELKTLDVAGLMEQLGLAQQAIEMLHQAKQARYTDLIGAQNDLLDSQKDVHRLKVVLKDLTNNTSKFMERVKIIKTMIRGEANG